MRLITEQDYDEIEEQADRQEERRRFRARQGKAERTILDKRGRPTVQDPVTLTLRLRDIEQDFYIDDRRNMEG